MLLFLKLHVQKSRERGILDKDIIFYQNDNSLIFNGNNNAFIWDGVWKKSEYTRREFFCCT